MLVNFFFASRIGREGRSEASAGQWLAIAVVVNLMVLGYYKYLFPIPRECRDPKDGKFLEWFARAGKADLIVP